MPAWTDDFTTMAVGTGDLGDYTTNSGGPIAIRSVNSVNQLVTDNTFWYLNCQNDVVNAPTTGVLRAAGVFQFVGTIASQKVGFFLGCNATDASDVQHVEFAVRADGTFSTSHRIAGSGGGDGNPTPSTWTPPAVDTDFTLEVVLDTSDETYEAFVDGASVATGTFTQWSGLSTPRDQCAIAAGHMDDSACSKFYWGEDLGALYGGGATVPAAITDLAGTAGDTQVPLTWTAPADGGSAITDYVVQYREV